MFSNNSGSNIIASWWNKIPLPLRLKIIGIGAAIVAGVFMLIMVVATIYNLFHGTQVSFPSRLFSKEHIHKAIISEYNGDNILQLAQKYNYSERSIWRILKSNK